MSSGSYPRHARRSGRPHWADLMAGFGPGRPRPERDREVTQPRRSDPLVHPVAITEHCVIGDQIRLPATRCDTPGCGAAFADPAALGETDNRARAAHAGWARDQFGRLICPGCQRYDHQAPGGARPDRMSPYLPEALPSAGRLPRIADGIRHGTGGDEEAKPAARPPGPVPAIIA